MSVATVETFEVLEAEECTPELDAEAIALAEKLGLSGQAKLRSTGESPRRSPYRQMTNRERFTYGLLCPTRTKVEAYDNEPIPLRVLQVLAHAKDLGIYAGFFVMHEAVVKDPVLVAHVGSEYSGEYYILARWGAELETFEVLVGRAIKLASEKLRRALAKIRTQLDADIACADQIIDPERGRFEEPSYYSNQR
jgi:hypothetical protein